MDKNKKSHAINMGIEQDLIVKKMSSLRTYYGQLRKKQLSPKNKRVVALMKLKNQLYFDSLSFLRESLTARQSTSNLNVSNLGSDFIDMNAVTASTPRNSRKHANSNNDTQQEVLSKALNVLSEGEEKEKAKMDDQIFRELIALSMAKVPEGGIKDKPKISIQQLILSSKRKCSSFCKGSSCNRF